MNRLLFIFIALLAFHYSHAATNISGQIRNNTTWTKAGNPYICSGVVDIAPNVVVDIDPGVEIVIDGALIVHGWLKLNATKTDSIFISTKDPKIISYIEYLEDGLTSVPIDTYNVQYCKFNNTTLYFKKNSMNVIVSDCIFEDNNGGIIWNGRQGAVLSIHDNYFSSRILVEPNPFDKPTGKIEIYNNIFEKYFGNQTIYLSHVGDNTYITNNHFINCRTAIKIVSVTKAYITGNVFVQNVDGIEAVTSTIEYHISGNIFTKNTRAMHLYPHNEKMFFVKHNSIYDNDYGVAVGRWNSEPIYPENKLSLDSNCIYNNKIANLYWGVTNDYAIGANWWGSTDTNVIDTGINDDKDDFHKGLVSYQPFLANDSGCKTFVFPPPASIPEKLKVGHSVSVFPNPFNNNITIEVGQTEQVREITLYDVVGKKVITQTNIRGNKAVIDTHHLAEGLYIYKITYEDNTIHSGKVLKQ